MTILQVRSPTPVRILFSAISAMLANTPQRILWADSASSTYLLDRKVPSVCQGKAARITLPSDFYGLILPVLPTPGSSSGVLTYGEGFRITLPSDFRGWVVAAYMRPSDHRPFRHQCLLMHVPMGI